MLAWHSGPIARYMHQALPVLWPCEWRVIMTRSGLYLVEADAGDGWQLAHLCFRLADAFAVGERLHSGPRRLAELWPDASKGPRSAVPSTYRVPTGDEWQASAFRAAVDDNPFSLEVGPDEAFCSRRWAQGLADSLAALKAGRNVLLLGAPGAGKTLFLRELARLLACRGVQAAAWQPDQEDGDAGSVVLVDDAGALPAPTRARLRASRARLVLATDPACVPSDLPTRGAVRIELAPLPVEEVAAFVASRMRAAGRSAGLAEPEAVLRLAQRSGGILRELVMLAGAAVFLADLERSPRLSVHHVEHAAAIAAPGGAHALQPAFLRRPEPGLLPRAWVMPAVRLGLAAAGLAFVALTGWSAQWVGTQARLAERAPAALVVPASVARASTAVVQAAPRPIAAPPAAREPAPLALAQADPDPSAHRDNDSAVIARADAGDDDISGSFDAEVAIAGDGDDRLHPDRARALHAPRLGPALVAPAGAGLSQRASIGSFTGPVSNETLRLTGKLALELSRDAGSGAVRARFHAWDGLLGTGELQGVMAEDGRVSLSGQLLMGKNPFLCTLTGVIRGDHFVGSARFVRPWGGRIAYSSFSLSKT